MKKYPWINVTNVKKIAHILLQLDHSNLPECHRLEATSCILQLQQAVAQYSHPPLDEPERKKWNRIENIEQSLKNLLIQVNAFMSLLTENAQQRIKQQFIHDTDGM